jgi:acyl-CoA synthetase (AMP-forming)/AMP-acid ligase II
MLGYLNAPSPFDEEGWFCTEDRVEVDGEWMRILGRVTDLMNIGGQKVYPAEVEDAILALPGIEDVAVYTEDNALLGKMIVAAVVPTDPDEPLSPLKKRIRRGCAERLAAFKVPSKVVLASESLYSARLKKVRRAKAA